MENFPKEPNENIVLPIKRSEVICRSFERRFAKADIYDFQCFHQGSGSGASASSASGKTKKKSP